MEKKPAKFGTKLFNLLSYKYVMNSVALMILVWGIGPYISIGKFTPFSSFDVRFFITLALALIWLDYGLYWFLLPKRTAQKNADEAIQTHHDLETRLKKHFKATLHYLRSIKAFSLTNPYVHPWILLIGPKNTGKTTLLASSDLELRSLPHRNLENVQNTLFWDWWASEQAVFIDAAGEYVLPKLQAKKSRILWHYFSSLLKRYRPRQPLSAAILILDTWTLCHLDSPQYSTLMQRFTDQLLQLQTYKSPVPITVIITQSDKLMGFSEYFEDLSAAERESRFGFPFLSSDQQPITQQFQTHFNKMMVQLSQRLLMRLHQERNLTARGRLKEFPVQLERLKPYLEKLIAQLPWDAKTPLKGLYFTSCFQTVPHAYLLEDPFHGKKKSLSQAAILKPKSFFIKELLVRLSNPDLYMAIHHTYKNWLRLASMPIAALLICAIALSWHYAYHQSTVALQEVQFGLRQLNEPAKTHAHPWIVPLNALQSTVLTLEEHHVEQYKYLGMQDADRLQSSSIERYHHLLITRYIPYLTRTLTHSLNQGIQSKPYALYSTLKTYLMLSDPTHRQADYVKQWFFHRWQKLYPDDSAYQHALMRHLEYVLTHDFFNREFDAPLVDKARDILQKMPVPNLAFMITHDAYASDTLPLLSKQHSISGINLETLSIPVFYSTQNVETIYEKNIPQTITALIQPDWVLGDHIFVSQDTAEQQNIINQTRALYLKNYAARWKKVLSSIQFDVPQTLQDAQSQVHLLSDTHSAFWRLVNIILANASVYDHYAGQTTEPSLNQLHALLNDFANHQALAKAYQDLNQYLEAIINTPDTSKASFTAALKHATPHEDSDPITHLLNMSVDLPEPMKTWVTSIVENAWAVILDSTLPYINTAYQNTVLPVYTGTIKDAYPLAKEANTSIPPVEFSRFFGPEGTLSMFFNYYLKPFVNTEHFYWTWKTIDGRTLPLSQLDLDMFLRGYLIQRMFFNEELGLPHLTFSLKAVALSHTLQSVILNVGGQMMTVHPHEQVKTQLTWPGPDAEFVTLRFVLKNSETPTITQTGPWALYQLLDQSKVENTANPKHYKVMFKQGENEADFEIDTPKLINPFVPNIMDKFKLPDVLQRRL